MREILFRGKRLGNGEWVEGFLSKWYDYQITEKEDDVTAYPIDIKTVGQFTGVTDVNGRKIFEGDIVNCRTTSYFFEKCKVVYESCYARYCLIDKHGYIYPMDESFEYEIIGNIHDNPELIGGADNG